MAHGPQKGSTIKTVLSHKAKGPTCSQQEDERHNKWARHKLQKKNLTAEVIQKFTGFGSATLDHPYKPWPQCSDGVHQAPSFTIPVALQQNQRIKEPCRSALTKLVKSLSKAAQRISTLSGWPVCKTPHKSVRTYKLRY